MNAILRRIIAPLASRKVRVALATVLAAYAGQYGLGVSEEMVFTILGVGAAVILGIAHEDAGQARTPVSIQRTSVAPNK
ncbi:MAG TPA: hypothetical protein PL151_14275 [Phycisphaerae bacterium]|nr:hypothetical protein [Phycisphaerae bacterium]HOJ75305.1 hypothetical protein [Phycisphaerae bacterium]HOM53030.1 hypothetical protein [Phycisphaerae bacterium]HON67539.1 hypothetical protein [Phycisphaerae bacterium]HOQ87211.1 hypothetical protein [Phycisphaerae bacterium]